MNLSLFFNEYRDSVDLNVYHCGMEECESSHSYGPAVRNHYLIHYILEGEGSFFVDGKTYRLKKNQGFLICPDVVTYYEADRINPWTYIWVGFNGVKAENYLRAANLTRTNTIFSQGADVHLEYYLKEMLQCNKLSKTNEVKLQGLLYLFLAKLIETNSETTLREKDFKELYIKKSIEYVEKKYSQNITISEMSKYIGLNRSYFSSLFKSYLNVSPQEFLIAYRVKKAEELLLNTEFSITSIAHSVGYEDSLTFSKVFKKIKGVSPREYRISHVK